MNIFNNNGTNIKTVAIKDGLITDNVAFIRSITFRTSLETRILSNEFREYLIRRNETLDLTNSQRLVM